MFKFLIYNRKTRNNHLFVCLFFPLSQLDLLPTQLMVGVLKTRTQHIDLSGAYWPVSNIEWQESPLHTSGRGGWVIIRIYKDRDDCVAIEKN